MKKFFSSTLFITGIIILLLAGIVGFVGLRTGAFVRREVEKKVTVISIGATSPLALYLKAQDYEEALKVSPSSKALQVLAGYQKKDFSGIADSGLRQALEKDIQTPISLPEEWTPKTRKIKVGVSWFGFRFDDDAIAIDSGFTYRCKWLKKFVSELDYLGVDYIVWDMQNVWQNIDTSKEGWYVPYDYFFSIFENSSLQLVCNTNVNFKRKGSFHKWEAIEEKYYSPASIRILANRYKDKKNKDGEKIIMHWMIGGDRANNFDWKFWLPKDANWQLHQKKEVAEHNKNVAEIYSLCGGILNEVGNAILTGAPGAKITLCIGAGNRFREWYEAMEKATSFPLYGPDSWGPHWKYSDYFYTKKKFDKALRCKYYGIWQTGWNYYNCPANDYYKFENNYYDPRRIEGQSKLYARVIRDCEAAGFDTVALGIPLFYDAPGSITCCYAMMGIRNWPGQNQGFFKGRTWMRNKNFEAIYKVLREKE